MYGNGTPLAAGGPITYRQMVEEAFQPAWWQSKQVAQINGTNADGTLNLTFLADPGGTLPANQFREEEFNFSLFFGLAIQMYEATLRSEIIERMFVGDGNVAVYDHGFYNTGVRQRAQQPGGVCDDVGVGATIGPSNLPLSFARYFQMQPT
jgi:hypothetical protein